MRRTVVSKSRAFTLVELLVVIAIIALLISILAPTLGTARELTKQLQCMTNLRSIGAGINIYAEASRGFVPNCLESIRGKPMHHGAATFMLAYGYVEGEFLPVNLGRLHAQGIIEHPETFYCPFPRPYRGFSSADEYPAPWGEHPLATKYMLEPPGAICSNYSYNPHLDTVNGGIKYRKTEEFPSTAIVTMDGLGSKGSEAKHTNDWIVHRINTFSVNVHYIDGHAENIPWPEDVILQPNLSGNYANFQEILSGLEAR